MTGDAAFISRMVHLNWVRDASREELQEYLERRGFGVYDHEDTEDLRTAVRKDMKVAWEEKP